MTDSMATPAASATSPLTPAAGTAPEALPRPRIQTGAVIWGLLLMALGGWTLWAASSRTRRAEALETVLTMTPLAWAVTALVVVGGAIALMALAAVIRRLQSR